MKIEDRLGRHGGYIRKQGAQIAKLESRIERLEDIARLHEGNPVNSPSLWPPDPTLSILTFADFERRIREARTDGERIGREREKLRCLSCFDSVWEWRNSAAEAMSRIRNGWNSKAKP